MNNLLLYPEFLNFQELQNPSLQFGETYEEKHTVIISINNFWSKDGNTATCKTCSIFTTTNTEEKMKRKKYKGKPSNHALR